MWTLILAGIASAQTFDVASVKRLLSTGGRFTKQGGPGTADPERVSYRNIPLRVVLLEAYNVRNYQLSGPDWLDTQRYDITVKLPIGATNEQFQAMMRDLLETRFQMKIHHELKDLSIYALVVAKGGPKIKPVASDGPAPEGQLAVVRAPEVRMDSPRCRCPAPGLSSRRERERRGLRSRTLQS
jgi:uncharacterized protein (TIGR03435 family)